MWTQRTLEKGTSSMMSCLNIVASRLRGRLPTLTPSKHFADKSVQAETDVYTRVGRSTYLRIDLDVIYNNINITRNLCSPNTDVIVVVKANAYGHGSVEIAKFLESQGIGHFAVATPGEGVQLRCAGVLAYIQVFGNASVETIPALLKYNLTPTVSEIDFLQRLAQSTDKKHQVVLKVDTAMHRNGCQPENLSSLVQYCRDRNVPVHSIMTHFAQAWDNPHYTKQQLATFMRCSQQYRDEGIKLHVSNSGAIVNGFGTDLDFIRPGILIYGLLIESKKEYIQLMQSLGLQPALSWLAHPTLVKQLPPGCCVGYDNKYITKSVETIATFSLGYADGYNRHLYEKAVVSLQEDDVRCPVVGKISMDAITVRLDEMRAKSTTFHIITGDFTSPNSVTEIAACLNTDAIDVTTGLSARLPRVFVSRQQIVAITK